MNDIAQCAQSASENHCSIADDLLEGADQISTFIYGDPSKRRKIYHLFATSDLPVFRLGEIICARKSRIREWIERQETRAQLTPARLAEERRARKVERILAAEKIGGQQ